MRRLAERDASPRQGLGKPLIPPFLKSSALDYNGTVALLTFVFTAEAQLVVGDSAGLRQKESKFLPSLIAHSGHRVPSFRYSCFSGRVSLHFRPVCRFQRRGGILTLPQRRNRHTAGAAAFTVFHRLWGMLFCRCIFSYKPGFPKCRNDFSNLVPVPQKKQNSITVTLPLLLCDGLDFHKKPTAAIAFSALLHLRHILVRRCHPGCVLPSPGRDRPLASAYPRSAEGGYFAWHRAGSVLPLP